MKRFSDFAEEPKPMDGRKQRLDDILNREIELLAIKITRSKFERSNSPESLMMQFRLDGETCVAFTGSTILAEQARKYQDQLPFLTTIRKVSKYYTFS